MSRGCSLIIGLVLLCSSHICFAETQTSPVLVRLTIIEPSIPSPPSPSPTPSPTPTPTPTPGNRRSSSSSSSSSHSSSSSSSLSSSLESSSSVASSASSSLSSSTSSEILKPSAPPPPTGTRTFVQEGPSQPILCLGPAPVCEAPMAPPPSELSCELPRFECSAFSVTCIQETLRNDVLTCGKSILAGEHFPSLTTLQETHMLESVAWSLWIVVALLLFVRFEQWFYARLFGHPPLSLATYSVAMVFSSGERGLRVRHLLHSLILALVVTAMLLSIFSYYEGTRAENLDIDVTIAERTLALSCTTPVDLGTFIGNGDSGSQSDDHSTLCTVFTTNVSGYSLHWQMVAPSSGEGTGSLLLSSGEDAIAPLSSSTPIPWPTFGSGVLHQWGARLASKSTTVDTSVWGVDGVSEKWAKVSTGSLTTIATRSDQTSIGGDLQTIGFRAAIDSSVNQTAGTYSASVIFSVITP